MDTLFRIPQDKIGSVVKSVMRQKAVAIIIAFVVCVLLEMQGNRDFHLLGFKNLSKLQSWLIIDVLMLLYMLFLARIAQQRFTAYYTGFRILLTNEGIRKYNVIDDDPENEIKAIQFFAWNEIKRTTEDTAGLNVLNGLSALIPGTRQIKIPRQIALFDQLKMEIKAHVK